MVASICPRPGSLTHESVRSLPGVVCLMPENDVYRPRRDWERIMVLTTWRTEDGPSGWWERERERGIVLQRVFLSSWLPKSQPKTQELVLTTKLICWSTAEILTGWPRWDQPKMYVLGKKSKHHDGHKGGSLQKKKGHLVTTGGVDCRVIGLWFVEGVESLRTFDWARKKYSGRGRHRDTQRIVSLETVLPRK